MSQMALKWIAIISMFIDHVGVVFFPDIIVLRIIGRLAMPIYCFLIVNGFAHTRNVMKYAGRLLIFALISQIPFWLAFEIPVTEASFLNVYFTLFLGLLAVWAADWFSKKQRNMLAAVALPALAGVAAEWLHADYGILGVVAIVLFYLTCRHKKIMLVCFAILYAFVWKLDVILPRLFTDTPFSQLWGPLLIPLGAFGGVVLVCLYNGKKNSSFLENSSKTSQIFASKWFFYLFYPLHLLVLGVLRLLIL